ncbi:MAG: DUF3307 domain-containing protein [Bacteroidales bacterium]|nr:DUF3307 domain-containing protein [Bacteroidales bacterium]
MATLELDILIRLLLAHFLSDFILQTDRMAIEKKKGLKSRYFFYHITITGIVVYLVSASFAGWNQFYLPLSITAAHMMIDLIKTYIKTDNLFSFLIDQSIHITVILLVWIIWTQQSEVLGETFNHAIDNPKYWLIAFGFIMMSTPSSITIGRILKSLDLINGNDDDNITESLKNAGKWIGIIERILIFTFVIIGKYEIVGFLIAAKSVFRFSEIKSAQDKKITEYILIGTLISFSVAIFTGLIIKPFL